jgi:hypothetical protein
LNRTESRIQNPVSRILQGNNLSVLPSIQDVCPNCMDTKREAKGGAFSF